MSIYEKDRPWVILVILLLFGSIAWWNCNSEKVVNPKDGVVFQIQKGSNKVSIRLNKSYINVQVKRLTKKGK